VEVKFDRSGLCNLIPEVLNVAIPEAANLDLIRRAGAAVLVLVALWERIAAFCNRLSFSCPPNGYRVGGDEST
jgi:hypothetical protein